MTSYDSVTTFNTQNHFNMINQDGTQYDFMQCCKRFNQGVSARSCLDFATIWLIE